jgi:hypothetical protein
MDEQLETLISFLCPPELRSRLCSNLDAALHPPPSSGQNSAGVSYFESEPHLAAFFDTQHYECPQFSFPQPKALDSPGCTSAIQMLLIQKKSHHQLHAMRETRPPELRCAVEKGMLKVESIEVCLSSLMNHVIELVTLLAQIIDSDKPWVSNLL